jgi:sugar phosphate isomerase/epimerase
MDRRAFLQAGVIAGLATKILGDATVARAQAPGPTAGGQVPAAPRKLIMDAYSRALHWIRDADALAEAAIELTCGGFQPTVQSFPGHIDPARVKIELPAFVATMRKHGLRVSQIRGGNQTAVDSAVEELVGTMGQVGATHYWLGTDRYDLKRPILPQLDAIKTKAERFVKLNERHGTTLMYHTRAGANSVGSVVWDLLYVMKDFDPKFIGFHWDTGHMAQHGPMWETLLRTAGPHVVAISWKDRTWQQTAPGPGGWQSPMVPMGTGLVDAAAYATAMRDIGFGGPMELQVEYPLGGAEAGRETITLPRDQVLGAMRKDVETIRAAFAKSGTGLTL